MRRANLLLLAFSFALGGCASTIGTPIQVSPAGTFRALVPHSISHVYVADNYTNQVFRFPIVGGIADSAPDLVLTVVKAKYPSIGGIGVDATGELFVAARMPLYSAILVYATGASGNAPPKRRLYVAYGRNVPLAVSSTGTVAIAENGIDIYAPGASGGTPPQWSMNVSGAPSFDGPDTLYVVSGNSGIIATTVLEFPTLEQNFCWVSPGTAYYGSYTDDETGLTYVPTAGRRGGIHIFRTDVKTPPCAPSYVGTHPAGTAQPFYPQGIAGLGHYIFVTDVKNHVAYQLDDRLRGAQAPIATLNGPFKSPGAIAIGP